MIENKIKMRAKQRLHLLHSVPIKCNLISCFHKSFSTLSFNGLTAVADKNPKHNLTHTHTRAYVDSHRHTHKHTLASCVSILLKTALHFFFL